MTLDQAASFSGGLFLWLVLSVALAQLETRTANLKEGDVCKQHDGTLWTCKSLSTCPKAQDDVKVKGKSPQICIFNKNDPVVCCEPEVTVPLMGAKSKQKCKEYAKSVFVNLSDPLGDGVIIVDTCMTVESLVPRGEVSDPREYPHLALIGYGSKNNTEWLCGGSLISEQFVISAAHCVHAGNKGLAKRVRLGDYNIESDEDEGYGLAKPVEFEMEKIIPHPEWKQPSLYNDIALFKLKGDVKFNDFIRPICLQTDHQLPNTYAITTGWETIENGRRASAIPQKVNLTITQSKACSDAYIRDNGEKKLSEGILDETMLCAGSLYRGKEICQDNSGNPLQVKLKEPYCMYSLVGVSSFGNNCSSVVYTRVSHYVPWIESVVWP